MKTKYSLKKRRARAACYSWDVSLLGKWHCSPCHCGRKHHLFSSLLQTEQAAAVRSFGAAVLPRGTDDPLKVKVWTLLHSMQFAADWDGAVVRGFLTLWMMTQTVPSPLNQHKKRKRKATKWLLHIFSWIQATIYTGVYKSDDKLSHYHSRNIWMQPVAQQKDPECTLISSEPSLDHWTRPSGQLTAAQRTQTTSKILPDPEIK